MTTIAVSTTDSEARAARLLGPPELSPDLSLADRLAFAVASSRASLALFVDESTRDVLTGYQHVEVCLRAGWEALEAARAERLDATGWANCPDEVP